ncbi:hypothetical protein [Pseudomonas petrae]|uniref:Uncharacterized protein n=1 Tax=Pseudomonas petrae TaxID=2912190 RepID=A0ABS9ID80_9PSED|nr:hypothetical protein [Pseudomonas petrae]MCF7545690.1 hypothetical protein [Pseudomonas petrae]
MNFNFSGTSFSCLLLQNFTRHLLEQVLEWDRLLISFVPQLRQLFSLGTVMAPMVMVGGIGLLCILLQIKFKQQKNHNFKGCGFFRIKEKPLPSRYFEMAITKQ